MAATETRESSTRSARILVSIKDYNRTDIGRYAGWRDEKESSEPAEPERTGPSLAPFLRWRHGDRWWRVGLGFFWVPAIIVIITVEDWLNVPQEIQWISLGVLFVAFVVLVFVSDRLMR